jgi:hypothetical protein
MNQRQPSTKSILLVFNLIFVFMLGSDFMYVVISYFVTVSHHTPAKQIGWLVYLYAAVAAAIFGGIMLPGLVLKEESLKKTGSKTAAAILIIGVAMASFIIMDFAAVVSLAMTFMTMNARYVYPGAAAAAAGMLIARGRITEWFDKLDLIFPLQ